MSAQEMKPQRSPSGRPIFDPSGLPASAGQRMVEKAASLWCYESPLGGTFFVSEDQAIAMAQTGGGTVWRPEAT